MKVVSVRNITKEHIEINHDVKHVWTSLEPGGELLSGNDEEFEVFNIVELKGKTEILAYVR